MSPAFNVPRIALAAAALCILTLAIGWPGIATFDTVSQYGQLLDGVVDDWHPPIMVRLWSLLHPLGDGAGPMFVLQVGGYWLGLGLIATALARGGRSTAAVVVLLIGACPVFLGWQIAVLKDAQMTAAILAAVGLFAWWRLRGRALPQGVVVAVVLLLCYATLVRANGVFATVPLAVALVSRPVSLRRRVAIGIVGIAAVLLLSPAINHGVLRATPTEVSRTQPIYDLIGIAHFTGNSDVQGLLPAERAMAVARHCYTPFFWDPLGDDTRCGVITERLNDLPHRALTRDWIAAILHHPIAYAMHRLGHLNSTDRWIVPAGWTSAAPPEGGQPNAIGLDRPGPAASLLVRADQRVVETPLGWPIAWIVAAASCAWIAHRQAARPSRDLALALVASALTLEGSFALVSIASDLRYHLWAMIAAALSVVLLADRKPAKRHLALGAGVLLIVVATGTIARVALPPPPPGYRGMLG